MPMNATQMATERIAAVSAVNSDFDGGSQAEVTPELVADCQAIIDHIINNATTQTVVTGGSSAGTYSGTVNS